MISGGALITRSKTATRVRHPPTLPSWVSRGSSKGSAKVRPYPECTKETSANGDSSYVFMARKTLNYLAICVVQSRHVVNPSLPVIPSWRLYGRNLYINIISPTRSFHIHRRLRSTTSGIKYHQLPRNIQLLTSKTIPKIFHRFRKLHSPRPYSKSAPSSVDSSLSRSLPSYPPLQASSWAPLPPCKRPPKY